MLNYLQGTDGWRGAQPAITTITTLLAMATVMMWLLHVLLRTGSSGHIVLYSWNKKHRFLVLPLFQDRASPNHLHRKRVIAITRRRVPKHVP